MRLLLFNPETEYALASGASFYTPPARVEAMRRERQLLPEAWAEPDDIILVDDPAAFKSRFRLASWAELSNLFQAYPELAVDPWGWNPALIRRLRDAGVPSDRLLDNETMDRLRNLAHRRTTILLNTLWNQLILNLRTLNLCTHGVSSWEAHIPVELTDIEDCMKFYHSIPGCWMKAPWSSSGRGVINTAADMSEELVEQWCRGIIRRQGSVMGETPADRIADFATEWMISESGAHYVGLSCFNTSNRGKYLSNDYISQHEMKEKFDTLSKIPIEAVIAIQKKIMEMVLTGYEGPCGVDMLIERDGHLRPFVELNLRRTMGMITIYP